MKKIALFLYLLLFFSLIPASSSLAHTELVKTNPESHQTLTQVPDLIILISKWNVQCSVERNVRRWSRY